MEAKIVIGLNPFEIRAGLLRQTNCVLGHWGCGLNPFEIRAGLLHDHQREQQRKDVS